MYPTATEMLSAVEARLGKEEMRRQIDALRRDLQTGMIRISVIAAVTQLYQQQLKEIDNGR